MYKTGSSIYFCVLPDCGYKVATQLALGKRAICWRCHNEFQMNDYSIRLAKPHCDKCHKRKDKNVYSSITTTPTASDISKIIASNASEELRKRLVGSISTSLKSSANDKFVVETQDIIDDDIEL